MKFVCIAALLAVSTAWGGMIGDPVTSQLILSGGNIVWTDTGNSGVVGAGTEFIRTDNAGGFNIVLSLNLTDTTFTLTHVNPSTSGSFNLGLLGFVFTDLNRDFADVILELGNTFPAGNIISAVASQHSIQVNMNESLIPGGTSWTATWDVTFATNPAPEPATNALIGAGLIALIWFGRRR